MLAPTSVHLCKRIWKAEGQAAKDQVQVYVVEVLMYDNNVMLAAYLQRQRERPKERQVDLGR